MPANQPNALHRDPNHLDLTHVATYQRLVDANLERVWENVLDWEHLPHLHDSSFDYCELDEAGDWGWRTWSNTDHTDHIELCVGQGDYVARTYRGGQQVSEIWTTLTPAGNQTRIAVEFLVAGVTSDMSEAVGEALLQLYTQLWDEDEAMMQQRQKRLDEARESAIEIDLGDETALLEALPVTFQLRRLEYALRSINGQWLASPTICPHLLGPLDAVDESATHLHCPWHGYLFDRVSGECLRPTSARCRLPRAPDVTVESGRVIARFG